jgi:hypothetical protein
MIKIRLLIILLLISRFSFSQVLPIEYHSLTNQADSLFEAGKFNNAALKYMRAFEVAGGRGIVKHRYRAACSWAETSNIDSAFVQLNQIATKGKYPNMPQITSEKHFLSLHEDRRWKPLLAIINENMLAEQERLNRTIPKNNK